MSAKPGGLGDLSSLATSAKKLKRHSEKNKDVDANAGKPLLVPMDQIDTRVQSRKRFRYIDRLAKTIEKSDLQQPIVLYREGSRFVIQNGERRYRAFKLLGRKEIPAIITEKTEGLQLTTVELLENLQRDALTATEVGAALQQYRVEGKTQAQIAEIMGRSEKWVSVHLAIVNLPEPVADLQDGGFVTDADVLNELRKLHEVDPGRCEVLCAATIEDGISRKAASQALADAKRTKAAMEADRNRSKDATINSQEQAADTEHNRQLKESGLDEEGADLGAGEEKDESGALKQYDRTEPSLFTLKVRVTESKPYEAIIVTDRLDNDPSFMWVKRFKRGGKAEYKRVHCSNVEVLCVEQRVL